MSGSARSSAARSSHSRSSISRSSTSPSSISRSSTSPSSIPRSSTSPSSSSGQLLRRLGQLYVGLALYGVSSAVLVRGGLGLEPWGVLHQGLAERTGLAIGVISIIVGALVLLLWIPMRQRPGLGTVSNVVVIGLAMDGTLSLVPEVHSLAGRIALMAGGILLNGVASGLYIAARFGPGPRDGLMTGMHRLTGRSIRLVRTGIEIVVVATGFLLGGTVGVGTVAYALAIGPLAQYFLRLFAVPTKTAAPRETADTADTAETAETAETAAEPTGGPSAAGSVVRPGADPVAQPSADPGAQPVAEPSRGRAILPR